MSDDVIPARAREGLRPSNFYQELQQESQYITTSQHESAQSIFEFSPTQNHMQLQTTSKMGSSYLVNAIASFVGNCFNRRWKFNKDSAELEAERNARVTVS